MSPDPSRGRNRDVKPEPFQELPNLVDQDPAPIRGLRFAVIDCETTGGSPKDFWDRQDRFHPASEITEVGVMTLAGTIVEANFQKLCAVERGIPPIIQRLTGITPAMLQEAPSWERVALQLAPVLEGRIWVAHHAPFDGSFLKAYLPQGMWSRHRLICTVRLARKLVPEAPSKSLGALVAFLGLSNRRPPRALPDAEATAELLQHLIERAEAAGMEAKAFLEAGEVQWKKL
jgi:DNA polymerase III epsilon subunit-like protein